MVTKPELYLEDAKIGRRWRTPGRTLGVADSARFAGLSGSPVSVSAVPDLLGLCIASGLLARPQALVESVLALTQLEWKFHMPLMLGDTLHLEAEILDRVALPDGETGFVRLGLNLVNQRAVVMQSEVFTLLLQARGDAQR